jgi:hypothetical protein
MEYKFLRIQRTERIVLLPSDSKQAMQSLNLVSSMRPMRSMRGCFISRSNAFYAALSTHVCARVSMRSIRVMRWGSIQPDR